jgi:hypothetical protein
MNRALLMVASTAVTRTQFPPQSLSTKAGKARLYVGSGDALTIWLNGHLVFDKQVHRSAEPDEDAVDVDLREGENLVLVKISRGIGPNGLYFRVAAGSS